MRISPLLALLLVAPALAGGVERSERTLDFVATVTHDRPLHLENLIGSITVRGGAEPGTVSIDGRVVAEAPSREQADALAAAIRLESLAAADSTRVRVGFPVDRVTSFRLPRGESQGVFARWIAPLVRRETLAATYGEQPVEIGQRKGSSAVAVHLDVRVPYDVRSTFRLVAGTLRGVGLRGDNRFEIVEGGLVVEQSYGTLRARTGGGEVLVSSFRGDELDVHTGSGAIELAGVEAATARVRTASGTVRGNGLKLGALAVDSDSGPVVFDEVEARSFEVATESGTVDLGTRLGGTRAASIRSRSGDVTLRVGALSYFDLVAETRPGAVRTRGLPVEVVEEASGTARLTHGRGGTELRIATAEGTVTLRPL